MKLILLERCTVQSYSMYSRHTVQSGCTVQYVSMQSLSSLYNL